VQKTAIRTQILNDESLGKARTENVHLVRGVINRKYCDQRNTEDEGSVKEMMLQWSKIESDLKRIAMSVSRQELAF
jgi:hypothetical protein